MSTNCKINQMCKLYIDRHLTASTLCGKIMSVWVMPVWGFCSCFTIQLIACFLNYSRSCL